MLATVLSIGDELLAGDCVDTNASWLCSRLAAAGITVEAVHQLPDDRDTLAASLRQCARRGDLVVTTGGLGPTPDDLTREAMADAFDEGLLVMDDAAGGWIRQRLESMGLRMSDAQSTMARRPVGATCLPNDAGTAPVLCRVIQDSTIWCLPGPPHEMRTTYDAHVADSLPPGDSIASREVRCSGIVEADAARRLGDLLDRDRAVQVGTRVTRGIFIATVHDAGIAGDEVLEEIRRRLAPWAFGCEGEHPANDVARLLLDRSQTLSTAESCTGGWIGSSLVDVPGSSDWFLGGVVAYSNPLKQAWLAVPPERFEPGGPGAVSEEVARDMAIGIRETTGSDWGLSVTGLAGPDGGSDAKPVGTVWFGIASSTSAEARHFRFSGSRGTVRHRSVFTSLQCLRMRLLDATEPLAWECTR